MTNAELILIDVPIGLPWTEEPVRPCDRLARQVLGKPRSSSVFPVPCRAALAAPSIESAREINVAHLNRSIGVQTWAIAPKIAEVDVFLLSGRPDIAKVREVHPEVCFWALAGRRPMRRSKLTRAGRDERLEVLSRYEPAAKHFLESVLRMTARHEVQADDVLDALAALVTAEAQTGTLQPLRATPFEDPAGLPLEMLYLKCGGSSGTKGQPQGPTLHLQRSR